MRLRGIFFKLDFHTLNLECKWIIDVSFENVHDRMPLIIWDSRDNTQSVPALKDVRQNMMFDKGQDDHILR